MHESIVIRGARTHNLKNISLELPRHRLIVISGPSGSGKSSLAFDTLYAEGQRRYLESLSTYTRQFLERMPRPDVDWISGISPAIAIEQKNRTTSPRSTVGTITEIYDYLRLLFSRIGRVYCPQCGEEIRRDSPQDVYHWLLEHAAGGPVMIGFPLSVADIPETYAPLDWLKGKGFKRVWAGGRLMRVGELQSMDVATTDVVIDRIAAVSEAQRARIMDSLESAFVEGHGTVVVILDDGQRRRFTSEFICNRCGISMPAPEPRLFSFNNPLGACPGCQGFGDMMDWDLKKIVPDPGLSLRGGAVAPFNSAKGRRFLNTMLTVALRHGIPVSVPFRKLTPEQVAFVMEGRDEFPGVRGFFRYLEKKKYKLHVRVFMARFRSYFTCTECHGARLRPEALQVKINGANIAELANLKLSDLKAFLDNLHLSAEEQAVADVVLKEVRSRLQYLLDVGLEYLTLNRRANTLSGGEYQRINLATALGSALTNTLYVLDEPTVGLHPRDTHRLVSILKALQKRGNTVVVVEHERAVIEHADYLVELGPAAGEHGGEVVFAGSQRAFRRHATSVTAAYIRGEKEVPLLNVPRRPPGKNQLRLLGAREHNLKQIDVTIPLGCLVVVTGVSGAGKSTLIQDVLYPALKEKLGQSVEKPPAYDDLLGAEYLDRVVLVDQSPIGRTPRSNPVTYVKAFDEIRKLFAATPQARAQGFKPGHFSFNVPGGRCEVCQGNGEITVEMHFMADVHLECDACKGRRFKESVLHVRYRGKSIFDVLNMTVSEALEFFHDQPKIVRKLKMLQDVGLGYLRLGQPAPTLSGGEAQRIKIAAFLSQKRHDRTLYLLDEPTTGLHFRDIEVLIRALLELLHRGASIIVLEHNLDVIKQADWIIDLGPEGGDRGGEVVAAGPPEAIVNVAQSYTGRFLKPVLQRGKAATLSVAAEPGSTYTS